MRITLSEEQKAHCIAIGIANPPEKMDVPDREWHHAVTLWKRLGADIDHELKAVGHIAWQQSRNVGTEAVAVAQAAETVVESKPLVSMKNVERLLALIAFLLVLLVSETAHCQWSQIKTITFQNSDNTVAGLAAGPFTIRPSSGTWSRSGTTWTLTVTAASGSVAWDAITNPLGGGLTLTQFANGNTFFTVKRKTDTSPTGAFFDFQNALGSSLCKLDIAGAFVGCSFPYANLTGVPALPANTTSTASNFFTAYNSTTGAFTKAQPAFGDLSGSATTAQLPGTGATTVNGVGCTLGSTCTVADSTKVPTTTTVNGHALSANVTVTASDVSLGSVTNDAQTKAAIVPNTAPSAGQVLAGNAGGTAYAPVLLSQDCTLASTGAITCTKTNNVAFGGGATMSTTAGGDLSGTLPSPTVAKVNGVAYAASPSTDTAPVITAANIATYKALPACTDTGGNHLNYDTTAHAFSCGTSGGAGGGVTSSTLTSGTIPKATGAAAIGNSSITDNGTTVATPEPVVVGTANVTTFGTAGGFGAGEGTAPTNVASTTACYPDSTSHEMKCATAGSSNFGILQRTAGAVSVTAQTATIATTTACAASAGACNVAGQYELNYNFWGTGTACSSVTAGKVVLTFTWTDENGVTHTAIPAPISFDQKSAAGNVTGTFNFNTALGTEGAYGSLPISTNGSVIQYAATYTACTTGTGAFGLRISATRMQ